MIYLFIKANLLKSNKTSCKDLRVKEAGLLTTLNKTKKLSKVDLLIKGLWDQLDLNTNRAGIEQFLQQAANYFEPDQVDPIL